MAVGDSDRPPVLAHQRFVDDRESFAGLSLEQRFRRIHDTNLWGAVASTSGLGSEMDATAMLRAELPRLLEKLGVEAEQAVAYFAWADDYGPDGQPRRTFSDMFFAEVRPFEEIFRADQSGGSEGGEQQGNQSGQGGANERVRLAELQKQIVIATWNLQREKTGAGGAIHP